VSIQERLTVARPSRQKNFSQAGEEPEFAEDEIAVEEAVDQRSAEDETGCDEGGGKHSGQGECGGDAGAEDEGEGEETRTQLPESR
jgi:hypothetical protein